jgi:hypothetical protein
VIPKDTLMTIQANLMNCMTMLYLADKDDQLAKDLAAVMIVLHEDIDIELMERMLNVLDA